MSVKVVTPPAADIIPLADLRVHLRIDADDTSEDGDIQALLLGAVGYAAHFTGRSIGSQTLELALDAFPCGAIALPQGPVTSITSIKYVDTQSADQTVSTGDYVLDDYDDERQWAVARNGTSWPSTVAAANVVKVRYVAGDLPAAIRSALMLHVRMEHDDLTADKRASYAKARDALLNTEKVWGI